MKYEIALLQDAYTGKESDSDSSEILLPDFQDCRYYTSSKNTAHIVILNPTLITGHLFTGENCVFITISTAEGEYILGNTYIRPSIEDFDEEIESWRHVITQRKHLSAAASLMPALPFGGVLMIMPEETHS